MAQFIYFRDGEEQKGPLDEKAVLELYNGAEFTSDVSFQIRSSETDSNAPFVILRDLILKNGPSNPFRDDFAEIDKKIEKAEKELAELRTVASKRSELEAKVAEIEKRLEEAKKRGKTADMPEEDYRQRQEEKEPLCKCPSCGFMLANWKQCLIHINQSCPDAISRGELEKYQDNYEKWKKEDADRLTMGRRLFAGMSNDEMGSARPQTDFIEDVNAKLKKDMALTTEAGKSRSVEFLKSDAAMKIKTRLEKHLKEAKGKLVCKKCDVACLTWTHFIIHLTTYDHRFKVKNTYLELVSLLLGWFNRGLYLEKAHPSEFKEDEPELKMDSLRVSGDDVWTRPEMASNESRERREKKESSGHESSDYDCEPNECGGDGMMDMMCNPDAQKENLVHVLSQQIIISCTECNAMYTNLKQFLVHVSSDQHVENVRKVDQSHEEAESDRIEHQQFISMFDSDLQKWRWSDRVGLAGGKKIYEGWNDDERRDARPKKEFMLELNKKLGMKIKKKANGKFEEYFLVAEKYLMTSEARNLMHGLEKHLKEKRILVCTPCKYGSKDLDSYYIHCMTYDHVRITQESMYELPTVLIGVNMKNLYV